MIEGLAPFDRDVKYSGDERNREGDHEGMAGAFV